MTAHYICSTQMTKSSYFCILFTSFHNHRLSILLASRLLGQFLTVDDALEEGIDGLDSGSILLASQQILFDCIEDCQCYLKDRSEEDHTHHLSCKIYIRANQLNLFNGQKHRKWE